MKYLNKLLAYINYQTESEPQREPTSASSTSTLYSFIFINNLSQSISNQEEVNDQISVDKLNKKEIEKGFGEERSIGHRRQLVLFESGSPSSYRLDRSSERRQQSSSRAISASSFTDGEPVYIDDSIKELEGSIKIPSRRYSYSYSSQRQSSEEYIVPELETKATDIRGIDYNNRKREAITVNNPKKSNETDKNKVTINNKTKGTYLSSLSGYFITAIIGKTTATTSAIQEESSVSVSQIRLFEQESAKTTSNSLLVQEEEEDDWILIENNISLIDHSQLESKSDDSEREPQKQKVNCPPLVQTVRELKPEFAQLNCLSSEVTSESSKGTKDQLTKIRQKDLKELMALDKSDIEPIKASWLPAREDPVASGVLLFRGLFTKFPQYLEFFPQFADIDIERLQDNKRLLKHAVKVIETVTFVVDSLGDEKATDKLNEALVNLVKSHLRRKIGLKEFRNLGIVLIDFICDVNQRGGAKVDQDHSSVNKQQLMAKSSASVSSNNESDTMTSALDKLRSSSHSPSSSSSSEEDNYSSINSSSSSSGKANSKSNNNANYDNVNMNETDLNEDFKNMRANENPNEVQIAATTASIEPNVDGNNLENETQRGNKISKINTNSLVSAWTKLYGSILDLVKREEAMVYQAQAQAQA